MSFVAQEALEMISRTFFEFTIFTMLIPFSHHNWASMVVLLQKLKIYMYIVILAMKHTPLFTREW